MKSQLTFCLIAICLINFSMCNIDSHINDMKNLNSRMSVVNRELAQMAKNGASQKSLKSMQKKVQKIGQVQFRRLQLVAPKLAKKSPVKVTARVNKKPKVVVKVATKIVKKPVTKVVKKPVTKVVKKPISISSILNQITTGIKKMIRKYKYTPAPGAKNMINSIVTHIQRMVKKYKYTPASGAENVLEEVVSHVKKMIKIESASQLAAISSIILAN